MWQPEVTHELFPQKWKLESYRLSRKSTFLCNSRALYVCSVVLHLGYRDVNICDRRMLATLMYMCVCVCMMYRGVKRLNANSKPPPIRCNVSWFIYFYRRSTCFRRFLRPSSGAHNCTYSFRYCQSILLLAATTVAASSSWWWAEEPPETCCRASVKIKKPRNVASCWL